VHEPNLEITKNIFNLQNAIGAKASNKTDVSQISRRGKFQQKILVAISRGIKALSGEITYWN
jgi:hypothetical protein